MEEKLIDTEILEEGTELVEGLVSDHNIDLKKVGIGGLAIVGVAAIGTAVFKFGKKKWAELKAKEEEPKKAVSNIQPSKEEE